MDGGHQQSGRDALAADIADCQCHLVGLQRQEIIRPNREMIRFEIEPFRKEILLEGLDDIALTLKRGSAIDAFEQAQRAEAPWRWV